MMERWPEFLNGVSVPYGRPVKELRLAIEQGETEQKWVSFLALAREGSDASLKAVSEFASGRDPHVRRAAVEAIGRHARGSGAAATVGRALKDESELVVRTACSAAAKLRLIVAHDAVLRIATTSSGSTQNTALQAITVLWQAGSFAPVFRVYSTTQSEETRREAAWAMVRNAGKDTWRTLFDAWRSDCLARHRVWASELAEHFSVIEVEADLRKLAEDEDGHVRKAALRALERLE